MPKDRAAKNFSIWSALKEAASDWSDDKAPRLGAALAYYTVFSLSPILVLTLSIAGAIFGGEFVQSHFGHQLDSFLGKEGSSAVQSLVKGAQEPEGRSLATIFSVVTLLIGAAGVFIQLKDALNSIWEVEVKPGISFWRRILNYIFSFSMVMAIAFLFLVSLLITTVLAAMTSAVKDIIPGPDVVAHVVDAIISLAMVILLFALIFKYLPDVKIAWTDVWLGASLTGLLFTLGKYLISAYLSTSAVSSSYGAAGSLVVILVWCYYSSQILFFGAELTQVCARFRGAHIVPSDNARLLKDANDESDH
jgi:membrane protein